VRVRVGVAIVLGASQKRRLRLMLAGRTYDLPREPREQV
jgi:hypothetical protein